jgi:GNAT superfamily N-acetyltransferase
VTLVLRAPRYGDRVPGEVAVAPITLEDLDEVLPLIAAYQRFYEAEEIDEDRNRTFFRRFLGPSDDGLLLGARAGGELLGFTCLYWTFSSVHAAETVLLNDLFVAESARGRGAGRALIEAAAEVARARGVARLEWVTATDNHTAQRLYDRFEVKRSEWFEYELWL